MFTSKTVHILDEDIIKDGHLITFATMNYSEKEERYVLDRQFNGLIRDVTEDYFNVRTVDNSYFIHKDSIINSPTFIYERTPICFKIIGVSKALEATPWQTNQ